MSDAGSINYATESCIVRSGVILNENDGSAAQTFERTVCSICHIPDALSVKFTGTLRRQQSGIRPVPVAGKMVMEITIESFGLVSAPVAGIQADTCFAAKAGGKTFVLCGHWVLAGWLLNSIRPRLPIADPAEDGPYPRAASTNCRKTIARFARCRLTTACRGCGGTVDAAAPKFAAFPLII
jgi:hypothetical protein